MRLPVGACAGEIGTDDSAIGNYEAGDHGPFGEVNALMDAGKGYKGAADLRSRGVAVGVEDARQRVRAFSSAEELAAVLIRCSVEGGSPFDQLGYARWALGYKRFGGGTINDSISCIYGVFKVERDVFAAFHGNGDATLRIVSVRLGEGLLGDDEDLALMSQLDGSAKACHARAHHQKIYIRRQCHNL
jgi:hypothetical protein